MKKFFIFALFLTFCMNVFAEDSVFDKIDKSDRLKKIITVTTYNRWASNNNNFAKQLENRMPEQKCTLTPIKIEWRGRAALLNPDALLMLKLKSSCAPQEQKELKIYCDLFYSKKYDSIALTDCTSESIFDIMSFTLLSSKMDDVYIYNIGLAD